ncbi:acetaldehyde dehydrogenase (acetylating) [Nonomuraea sp. NN258]|nr:acetaldehyde dehydrogenase (acetylating) [Nonomuraea antri]
MVPGGGHVLPGRRSAGRSRAYGQAVRADQGPGHHGGRRVRRTGDQHAPGAGRGPAAGRPEDRPDQRGRAAPARRRPAGLRHALRRHGLPRRAARARGAVPAAQGRGGDRARARRRPGGRAVHGGRRDQGGRLRAARHRDRRLAHRRLGHLAGRHDRRQRLQRRVRAGQHAHLADRARPAAGRHDDDAARPRGLDRGRRGLHGPPAERGRLAGRHAREDRPPAARRGRRADRRARPGGRGGAGRRVRGAHRRPGLGAGGVLAVKVAIIGSGNIGTDLMFKALLSKRVEVVAMAGIDPESDGLARARRRGLATTAGGVDGLVALPEFAEVSLVLDATSAGAHAYNSETVLRHGKRIIDLTPAAIGPYVVPPVNLEAHLTAPNLNLVTCGGQATIPIVAAVSAVAPVRYAEIVASIASKSAGPGTRANIDEFTQTTSRAIEKVGGAERGKAIIVLNPAEPPLIMRDTVYCLVDDCDEAAVAASVEEMVARVAAYVPGYRLKQRVQFTSVAGDEPVWTLVPGQKGGVRVSVFLEVEGAAHYLPAYAGNLDIMTAAALRTAERLAEVAA